MNIVKKTVLALVVNLLIIVTFFVFVNCFQKQELWPVVVSGIFLLSFIAIKLLAVSKSSRSHTQQRYYR